MHPTWREVLRGLAFVAMGLFMTTGPVVRQALGRDGIQWLRPWRMYHGIALGVCQVRYERRTDLEGEWVWFRRRPFLEEHGNRSLRILPNKRAADRSGRYLCRLHEPGTEIRYRMRCGGRTSGWAPWTVSENLCAGVPDAKRRRPSLPDGGVPR